VAVVTAAELEAAAREEFAGADLLLMAAAVADFRPRAPEASKIAKAGRERLELELEPTADVLAALTAGRRSGQTLVGFAAEHGEGALERAGEKLTRKGLDAVVVNDISRDDIGFDSEQNEVTILSAGSERVVPRGPKGAVAAAVLDEVERIRGEAESRASVGEDT
jgi:phosphopantothenoylcysteine decarboxylase / phosphopantothenate---cysteine ligase